MSHAHANTRKILPGPIFHEPVFNEGKPEPDPAGFLVHHPSDNATYAKIEALLKSQVADFPKSRAEPDGLYTLAEAYGSAGEAVTRTITGAKRIVFHALGDTGATSGGKAYGNELSVADQLAADCNGNEDANRPAFLLHLGDVVYDFGESKYYYDQFYEPYRSYPAPILAIAGNHDSFVLPGTPAGQAPLDIFQRNFCAKEPEVTLEAGSLHRTAMTQPGVYYAFDAPFVRIICLFSNALEDPGVVSSEGGHWPLPDHQLAFLKAQLQAIAKEGYQGAVLLAVHHPPFSYAAETKAKSSGAIHGGSPRMLHDIDTICAAVGVYPHAIISGHAHNYQRYTRTVKLKGAEYDVPFIVCGDGGHHVNRLVQARAGKPAQEPGFGIDVSYLDAKPAIETGGLLLEKYNDTGYGYLRISADAKQLGIGFHLVGSVSLAQSRFDKVTVDLASHTMISN